MDDCIYENYRRNTLQIPKTFKGRRKISPYNPEIYEGSQKFFRFFKDGDIQKEKVIAYRMLLQKKYQARTVNGKLSAVNAYLSFSGNEDCKVRFLKI